MEVSKINIVVLSNHDLQYFIRHFETTTFYFIQYLCQRLQLEGQSFTSKCFLQAQVNLNNFNGLTSTPLFLKHCGIGHLKN